MNDLIQTATVDTIRLDVWHMGTSDEEKFALQGIRREPAWIGSEKQAFDTLNLGDYLFTVTDAQTNLLLYSRGFNSNFDGTAKAEVTLDCLRFPFPERSVYVSLKKRSPSNVGFAEIWTEVIDPTDPLVDISTLTADAKPRVVFENGPPPTKVDLVVMGDGYTSAEESKFNDDLGRAIDYLFSVSPYKEHKLDFNVRSVFLASDSSGISSPLFGIWINSAFGSSYDVRGVERRIDLNNYRKLREAAATVPCDLIMVLTNSSRYGGIGLYQRYCIVAIDSAQWQYLVVHEFGHHLAGLADEYFTLAGCDPSQKAEPWEPNVTALHSGDSLKWADQAADIPIPTMWEKQKYAAFDSEFAHRYLHLREIKAPEDEVNALIAETEPKALSLLRSESYFGKVGAFEGASNEECGLFRPELDCTMFTLRPQPFCAVCKAAIERAISFYTQ